MPNHTTEQVRLHGLIFEAARCIAEAARREDVANDQQITAALRELPAAAERLPQVCARYGIDSSTPSGTPCHRTLARQPSAGQRRHPIVSIRDGFRGTHRPCRREPRMLASAERGWHRGIGPLPEPSPLRR